MTTEFRALDIQSVAWVYGSLAVLCVSIDWLLNGDPLSSWTLGSHPIRLPGIFFGLIFMTFYLTASWACNRWTHWARELELVFRQILTPISYLEITYLSILSGFIEEWFFRGILLDYFGLMLSSIFFGLAHLLPRPRIWLWSIWAFLTGIVFGLIVRATSSLVLVACIHTLINAIVLVYLNNTTNRPPLPASQNA